MRKEEIGCPYPETCRYAAKRAGKPNCLREACPFRIHLRRLVAGEIQRLSQKEILDPQQLRELEGLKGQYARLLRGGDRRGTETSQKAEKCPRDSRSGGAVFEGV